MNQTSDITQDVVFVRNVAIQAKVGLDCWQREKNQPAILSLRISTSIKNAGVSDSIDDTLDYRKVYKFLTSLDGKEFSGISHLGQTICAWSGLNPNDHKMIQCTVELPKALLHSEGISFKCGTRIITTEGSPSWHNSSNQLSIQNLRISCIIGIGAHERIHKQPVVVNLNLEEPKEENLKNLAAHLGSVYEVGSCKISAPWHGC
jgi:FolB domain-containing protein